VPEHVYCGNACRYACMKEEARKANGGVM